MIVIEWLLLVSYCHYHLDHTKYPFFILYVTNPMNMLKNSKQTTRNQFSCDVQSPPPDPANGFNPLRAVGLDVLKSWTG